MSHGWEIETSHDGVEWEKVGYTTPGGFNPYWYEAKVDAETAKNLYFPSGFARVVPSESVMEEKKYG